MATTSLWHIKGRLKDLIAYVENPEKTVAKDKDLQDFYNVFSYVSRPEATENGEYVSAINCLKEIALQQMILTKKQYGKDDVYIAWHGYQSFKPGEVTPEQAHEIGLQLAKEMWGEQYQIIVTTHLDKDHLHNHFCFNSVSFLDGRKYNYSKTEQRKLREASDRICREHGLSVIEKPHKAPSRQVWLDEKSGRPTRYNVYREDVKEAINFSRRPYYMEEYLRRKGYITDFTGKHWKIRLPQYEHFTRLDTLDERWTPEHIQRTMGAYTSFGNRRATITYPPQMPQSLRDWFKPFQKTSHIYKLYLHYCYDRSRYNRPFLPCTEKIEADVFLQGRYAVSVKTVSKRPVRTDGPLPQHSTESDCRLSECAESLAAQKEARGCQHLLQQRRRQPSISRL